MIPNLCLLLSLALRSKSAGGWPTVPGRSPLQQVKYYSRFHAFLRDLAGRQLLDFDERAAREFRRLRKSKIRIGTMDLRIAAIVLTHGATLITRNCGLSTQAPGISKNGVTSIGWSIASTTLPAQASASSRSSALMM